MENDSRFGVLGVNASGLDGERVELGRFGLAEVQKHGIIPPPPHPNPEPPKIFRKWLKLHARVRAALQLLVGSGDLVSSYFIDLYISIITPIRTPFNLG